MNIDLMVTAGGDLLAITGSPLILSAKYGAISHGLLTMTGATGAALVKKRIPRNILHGIAPNARSLRIIHNLHGVPVSIKDVPLKQSISGAYPCLFRIQKTRQRRKVSKKAECWEAGV